MSVNILCAMLQVGAFAGGPRSPSGVRALERLVVSAWWLVAATLCGLAALGFAGAAHAAEPERVVLQLKWSHQFQFAGYYAARARGYYAAAGLEVEIRPLDHKKPVVEQVVSGQATFGINDSGIVADYARGAPIVALAAIFQHDPLVFISRRSSGIISPYEMAGKRIMFDAKGSDDGPLRALLAESRLTPDKFTHVAHTYDQDDLASGRVDVMSAYLTDQVYGFAQRGIPINVINPQSYGIDFYGDLLFTSEAEARERPERVERFVRASLEGWRYALAHPDEIIKLIEREYKSPLSTDHLRFEAAETAKLILPQVIPLGHLDPNRIRRVATLFAEHRLAPPLNERRLQQFVFARRQSTQLTSEEEAWLRAHPVIRVGIDRDFAPYEWIDTGGGFKGINAEILSRLEARLGVRFEVVKGKTWQQTLDMAKNGQLDMLSDAVDTPERRAYLDFTLPFLRSPIVIVNHLRDGYIADLRSLYGRRVAVKQGYFMQELLAREHPRITLVATTDEAEGFALINDGQVDAYVGDAPSLRWLIEQSGQRDLRISATTAHVSDHSMAVIRAHPTLRAILDKTLASIPAPELDEIIARWMAVRIVQGTPLHVVAAYVASLLLAIALLGLWVRQLRREVSRRRAAEALARESEERFRGVFDSIGEAIFIIDDSGALAQVNRRMTEMYGVTEDEARQLRPGQLSAGEPPYSAAEVAARLQAATTEGPQVFEWLARRPHDNKLFWVEVNLRAARIGGRDVRIAVVRDIELERRARVALAGQREQLEALVQSRTHDLEAAKQAAEAASRAKGAFLANMSHEIRTPINAIVGMVHILRREGASPEQLTRLGRIDTAATHLRSVIDDILDVSKIEANKLTLDAVPLNFGNLLLEVRALFEERAAEAGLSIAVEFGSLPARLLGDPMRLKQALINYVSNAIKFTPKGGITLRSRLLEEDADSCLIRFEVEDTGIGMTSDVVARVFTAFEQADNSTTRRFGGTGLGLSITRSLAVLMGGDAGVRSEPGAGSCFWITARLKKASPGSAVEAPPTVESGREALLKTTRAPRHLLVADDEPVNREIAQFMLEDAGMTVDLAASGAEAVELAGRQHYDAILMDVQMPGLDGLQATRLIRAMPEHAATPIIAMTANAFADDRQRCQAAGMSGFLGKPFQAEDLYATLLRETGSP